MPTWRFHLTTGALLTIFLIYLCYYLGYWYLFVDEGQIQLLYWIHIIFVSLLGSLIPDFDKRKTKIRRTLGLILGGFISISILIIYHQNISINDMPALFIIVVLFLVVLFIIGIVIPFKHHGILHSILAALVFALSWVLLEAWIFNLTPQHAIVIGIFGFLGYCSHLVLDRDIKLM
jgi:hypothetical protein